jgi:hypothetical protein
MDAKAFLARLLLGGPAPTYEPAVSGIQFVPPVDSGYSEAAAPASVPAER